MPNLKEHLVISGVVSAGTYLFMCHHYNRKVDAKELFTCTGLGLVAGASPDIIEPSIHPHHRAVGHSIALGAGLGKYALSNCSRENRNWQEFSKILVAVVIVSYLAHLVADALTPRGLPVLGC